jgi:hypothetical protein
MSTTTNELSKSPATELAHEKPARRTRTQTRDPWDTTKAALDRDLAVALRHGTWERLRATEPELGRFTDPEQVVAFLHHRGHDVTAENEILVALVRAAQAGVTLAQALLCVALWPGLSAIRAKWLRGYGRRHAQLAADIGSTLILCVAKLDLTKPARIAATLCRNTARDLGRGRRRRFVMEAEPPAWIRETASDDTERYDAYECVSRESGRDAEVMLRVLFGGEDIADVASSLGVHEGTLRRRVNRRAVRLTQVAQGTARLPRVA